MIEPPSGRALRAFRKTLQTLAPTTLLMLGLGVTGASAANHTVQAMPSNTFLPNNLTIEPGDTVTFSNAGGFHNVTARDGSFRCANGCDGQGGNGDPSAAAWSFTLTFNNPGQIEFFCQPHEGLGMIGNITVVEGGGDMPGDLRLGASSQTRSEDGGSFSIQVQRINGDDGAVSVDFATSDGSAGAGSDYTATSGTLSWLDNDDDPRTITVPIRDDALDEPSETLTLMLSNPSGGAGLGSPTAATLTITDNDETTERPGSLAFASATASASEGAGSATLQVSRSGGRDGAVSVDFATSDGSAGAGSDYSATSGTLNWADGDSTARTIQIPLTDDAEEEGSETINIALSNATGGASLGISAATVTITDDDGGGSCTADADTLCLGVNDRFRAEIVWRVAGGEPRAGNAVDIGRQDSGLFFFFDENNIEMLLKVLNGCGLNDRYWVFYAATTDVEFELTVTDTITGTTAVYDNALGNAAPPVLDTDALATCP